MLDYKAALVETARQSFWTYCRLTSPEFYTKQRPFLKDLAKKLQWFVEESTSRIMVINMPPRHGKSRTATKFAQWLFGRYGKDMKIMTGSYNETLSETFARAVRDEIAQVPADNSLVYSDIFPETKIQYGNAAVKLWALEGSRQPNYLATSPGGTATGFGCDIMIIDDLIKNAEEAYNENVLQKHTDWFTNTMLQRTEAQYKIIIVMTRWATKDIAGFILENFDDVVLVNYKAVQDDGTMLCEDILDIESFKEKTKNMNRDIVSANYQQEPIDIKGRLYSTIKTFKELPLDESGRPLFDYILNYTDTADEGSDFLCSICYGVCGPTSYVLDVIYTQAAMEITEPATAQMLTSNYVGCAIIESNNGGRGFARSVERELEAIGNSHTKVTWFHQNQNKQARILSNSTGVMNNILFPFNWEDRWPEFAKAIRDHQREGKNAHDDAADALTGVYENPKPKGMARYNRNIQGGL